MLSFYKLENQIRRKLAVARQQLANAIIQEAYYSNERKYQEEHIALLESLLTNEKIIPKSTSVPKSGQYSPARNPARGSESLSQLAHSGTVAAKP